MLKITALFFNTFALLIYKLFFADVVTITQNIPSSVNPGSEFVVELTINKGSNSGFAKLQQELPAGFTAIEDKNNGATFTFNNQSVKLIWMSLPSDKEFKVSYKVKVDAAMSGTQNITGKFSYVADNVKQTAEIAAASVAVGTPSAATPPPAEPAKTQPITPTQPTTTIPSTAVATTPATSPATVTTSTGEQLVIDCFRKASETTSSPGEFPVEVTIKKGNLGGFAKFIETLPTGFTATVIEAKGAAFSFVDQKVKFVWGTLPSDAEFKISYKVSAAPNLSGEQIIEGVFSFIDNDQTKKYVLPQTSVKIGAPTTDVIASTPPPATSKPAEEKPKAQSPVVAKAEPKVPKTVAATTMPAGQGNVNYKVQILALRNEKNVSTVATILNVNETISTEMAEGFTKYTVGQHNEYKMARDARNQLPQAVVAPFVTAYNQGRRITVQEALMITSQKWFR